MRDRATFRPLRKPGPMTALDHIAIYLRDHDAVCPDCGYDLRGCVTNICPECGETFTISALRRGRRHPLTIAWFVGFAALVIEAPASLLLTGWILLRFNVPQWATWSTYNIRPLSPLSILGISVITSLWSALWVWFNWRSLVVAMPAWKQWTLALLAWALAISAFLLLR